MQAATLAEQGALLQALYENIPVAMTVIETGPLEPRHPLDQPAGLRPVLVDSAEATGRPLDTLPSPRTSGAT